MNKEPMPNLCMGLARFIGTILFLAASLWTFSYLNGVWELGIKDLGSFSEIEGMGYLAIALSAVAGVIAAFIGQGIGSAIPIRSDAVAIHINVAWHYLANVNIAWLVISSLVATLSLGEQAETFMKQYGLAYYIFAAIIASLGSQLIAWTMFLTGKKIMYGSQLALLLNRVLPPAIGVTMGLFQFGALGFGEFIGAFLGFLMPFVVISITGKMWRKDTLMRGSHAL